MFLHFLKRIDFTIIFCILPIMIAGILTMSSLTNKDNFLFDIFFLKQTLFILLSLSIFILISFLDYRFFRDSYVVLSFYGFSLLLLILLIPFGHTVHGTRAWFDFIIVSFEPTDLMKLSLIILLAKYFSKRHLEIANYKHILISFLYMFIPALLIMKQPDFGSAIVLLTIWLGLVFVSGISKKHLLVLGGLGLLIFILLWNFYFKEYQKVRVLTFINPNYDLQGGGYNIYQSLIAIGSGGLFGKGIGYGTQSRLNFLPEHETDFIFAAFLEEWGMFGGLLIFILFAILIFHLTRMAIKAESNFETLFILGVAIYLIAHLVINIGMNLGLFPVIGIPLPFMSYGGSHLVIEFLALGLCVGMNRYAKASHLSKFKNEFLGLE